MTDTLDQRLAAAAEWCRQRPEAAHIAAVIDEARGELPDADSIRFAAMRAYRLGDHLHGWDNASGHTREAYIQAVKSA